jgi:hypothetical protein
VVRARVRWEPTGQLRVSGARRFKWYGHGSEIAPMYQLVIVLSLTLGVLAAATWLGVAQLEAAHPPTGQFVEVRGVQLHVVALGVTTPSMRAAMASASTAKKRVSKPRGRPGGVTARAMKWTAARSG